MTLTKNEIAQLICFGSLSQMLQDECDFLHIASNASYASVRPLKNVKNHNGKTLPNLASPRLLVDHIVAVVLTRYPFYLPDVANIFCIAGVLYLY